MRFSAAVSVMLVASACARSGAQSGEDQAAPASSTLVYRARILDRDTLEPLAGLVARRVDGKVERTTDARGLLEFPLEMSSFGACHWSADGSSVACSMDDPKTTHFVVRGAGISPLSIEPGKYRAWGETATLLAWRAATITGVWKDAAGSPVANSKLLLKSKVHPPFDCEACFADLELATDASGAFHAEGVAARIPWTLCAADPEDKLVRFVAAEFALTPGEKRVVDVRSPPISSVRGVVRDPRGRPAQGVGLRLSNAASNMFTDTAADGSFEFERVGAGQFELSALFPDSYDAKFGCITTLDTTGAARTLRFDPRLLPLEEIDGRVLDAHGAPASDAEVWFDPETKPYSGRQSVAKDGSFRITVFPGESRLIATGEARVPWSAVRTVKSGAHGVELSLEPTGRIQGRVARASSTKAAKVEVHVRSLAERPRDAQLHNGCDSSSAEIEAGQDTFELTGLPPGKWAVKASIRDEQVSAEHILTVQADQSTTCPELVLKPSAMLWLINAPGSERTCVDVWCGGEACVYTELVGERLQILQVPSGSLRVVARRFESTLPSEQRIELRTGEQRVVLVRDSR